MAPLKVHENEPKKGFLYLISAYIQVSHNINKHREQEVSILY